MKKRILFYLLTAIPLAACSSAPHSYTQNYLIQHPTLLLQEKSKCDKAERSENECNIVNDAFDAYRELALEMQQEPQKFGKRILAAQTTCGELEVAIREKSSQLKTFTQSKPASNEMDLRHALQSDQRKLEEVKEEIANYLAVASLMSPA